MHIDTTPEGTRYSCDHCEYSAARIAKLKAHKESKHFKINYPCDQCNYVSHKLALLKLHQESRHIGSKYPCSQCTYEAAHKYALKRHMEGVHKEYLLDLISVQVGEINIQYRVTSYT